MAADVLDVWGLYCRLDQKVPGVDSAIDTRLRYFRIEDPDRHYFYVTIRRVERVEGRSVAPPDSPSRPVYDPVAGEIVYSDMCETLTLDDGNNVRTLCDTRSGAIDISVAADDPGTCWVASHSLFTIPLIDLLKRHGRYSLHAASLSHDGHGLLIAGTSGSCKTKRGTLALLRAGFDYLGDDMVFLVNHQIGVQASGVPDEVRCVTPDTVRFFPELSHLREVQRLPGWQKHQILPEDVYGVKPVMQSHPRVLLFPRVSGLEHSVITPLDSHVALLELSPNILLTHPASSQKHFDALGALVNQCRCYRLETGTDLASTGIHCAT